LAEVLSEKLWYWQVVFNPCFYGIAEASKRIP
jgi:hypothetical protein